jgi:hypothetical protein
MERNESLKKRYEIEAEKIRYLTKRKKAKNSCQRCLSVCKEKNEDESSSEDSDSPNVPDQENYKIIDMMIFSESAMAWQMFDVLITVCCALSSYFYLFFASSRNVIDDDEFSNAHFILTFVFEGLFFIHLVLNFFKEYTPEGGGDRQKPIREFNRIIRNYITTGFAFDFITLIPMQFLHFKRHRERLFYLIKVLRFYKGFKVFNVAKLMKIIKDSFDGYLEKRCLEDPKFANDREGSNNNIETILFISYGLKTLQLTIVILNISYILGMIWIIMCQAVEDFYYDTNYRLEGTEENEALKDQFIIHFGLNHKSPKEITIIVTYYMFTSLATVGFGDYHPRSNFERCYCAFVLLFGVATFSYIMGKFIQILNQFKSYNDSLDQGDQLNKFFGVLTRFNGYERLNNQFKVDLETFFDYKWKNDSNQAFRDPEDTQHYSQLPEHVQQSIYKDFLFQPFLLRFKRTFDIPNMMNPNQYSFYSFEDQVYRDFMMHIMSNLEPISVKPNSIIFDELEES